MCIGTESRSVLCFLFVLGALSTEHVNVFCFVFFSESSNLLSEFTSADGPRVESMQATVPGRGEGGLGVVVGELFPGFPL